MGPREYRHYSEIVGRLEEVRRRLAQVYVLERVLFFAAIWGAAFLALTALEGILQTPSAVRWLLAAALLGGLLAGAYRYVWGPLKRRWSHEQVAVRLERAFPELDHRLINAVQLGRDAHVVSPAIVQRIIDDAERGGRKCDFTAAVETRPAVRNGAATGLVLSLFVVFAVAANRTFHNGLRRLLAPGAYVPRLGRVELKVSPGDHAIAPGDDLLTRAEVVGDVDRGLAGEIRYQFDRAPEQAKSLECGPDGRFAHQFQHVHAAFHYQYVVQGTESPRYRVRLIERPKVTRIDVAYTYPKYTGVNVKTIEETDGNLRALRGTRVRLKLAFNKPVAKVGCRGANAESADVTFADDHESAVLSLQLRESGGYRLRLTDREKQQGELGPLEAVAEPDQPPRIAFVSPVNPRVLLVIGGKLELRLQAQDDYGLKDISLVAKKGDAAGPLVRRWNRFDDPKNVLLRERVVFDAKTYRVGDQVKLTARAVDNCDLFPAGETWTEPAILVTLIDPETARRTEQEATQQWRDRLHAVLRKQRSAREEADRVGPADELNACTPIGRSLRRQQVEIRKAALDIAQSIINPKEADVGATLNALANNEMAVAVRCAEGIAEADFLIQAKQNHLHLVPAQDRIIAALEKLLGVLGAGETAPKKDQGPDREGGDLPSDEAREKLKKLHDALQDFVREQKKVIDVTADLAKMPVENFDQEDEKKLEEVKAVEDKWAKFLREAHSDLSKLPEQDFSDPTLLKELVETYSEVQMAKDALEKKAVEIATPLEENGLELAKELTTQLEKWLPDTPDRDRWQMEEPLGSVEAPMAELPKELQDLVGELMEQEEDLLQEAEDASSGYADSLDKGAGWDAMDGPISNLSAQGVTGNRLPNESEIGGRSGEGRTGKASGEMVEDAATGKGGRKTPTRLTPDPLEKGNVKDSGDDPAGGATGGGKGAGAGAEGLEGPVPPDFEVKMKQLAQRQAALRNRLEKIQVQFKVSEWPTMFDQALESMKDVEKDLRGSRHRSIYRRVGVILKDLKKGKEFLADQMKVRRDTSTPLPASYQRELSDSKGETAPEGYESLVQQYFEALSTSK